MFIYNLKIHKNIISRIFLILVFTVVIILFLNIGYRFFNNGILAYNTKDKISESKIMDIETKNYTNALKTVHDDLNTYIGKKIRISGYVHRLADFNENQFVVSRDMIISSDFQTVIVGFLCNYKKAKDFTSDTWVEIEGVIEKGEYKGEIPIINIKEIKIIEKSSDIYVYPPDELYVPTTAMF